jgi:23S rRNA pseudouridine1911/1915/1917 synthase
MYGCGSRERPGVVHRLDIGTSGVMVFAKTPRAYRALREAFESHGRIRKTYLAVLHGAPKTKTGRIENTIGRKPWDSKRMAVDVPDGKRAVSEWTVLAKKSGVSLVEFVIETGRTHQIRVHAADLGCPIVGDELYGDAAKDRRLRVRPTRALLHAVMLSFPHPANGLWKLSRLSSAVLNWKTVRSLIWRSSMIRRSSRSLKIWGSPSKKAPFPLF